MSELYAIKWVAIGNGNYGYGTGRYPYEQAKRIAADLNRAIEGITIHTAVPASQVKQTAATPQPTFEPSNWGQPGFAKNRNKRPGGRQP